MIGVALSLLGPFEVLVDGTPATGFHSDKVRALLAYLAVEAERPHRREALAALLWPDQPESAARHSLRQALSNLRQVLGDQNAPRSCLDVTRQTIAFKSNRDFWLDTAAFSALLATSQAHRHRRIGACRPCLKRMEHMVDLYRGDFLTGFSVPDSIGFAEWILRKQEGFHLQVLAALRHLADFHERAAAHALARTYALRQIELEPWREEAHRQVMRLLALLGDRTAALAQYQACRHMLARELGVEPAAPTTALYERIRDGEVVGSLGYQPAAGALTVGQTAFNVPVRQRPPAAYNVPPALTTFVGRDNELASISDRLARPDHRLITLVGPGGIGKSRLAVEGARQQIGLFSDGVYWAPLGGVESAAPDQLVPAIAAALRLSLPAGQDARAALIDYLRPRELLLVLDSFEHLIEAADLVLEILRSAPAVSILVTSRERLKLQSEVVLRLRGLPCPSGQRDPGASDYAAVRLFVDRAGRSQMSFRLTAANVPSVIHLCRLVEGMPLGIELAAAWVGTHSLADIAAGIDHNLDFLATTMRDVPAPHRSLRAVFEHSWGLLAPAARTALQRLTVFRGGFTPAAAAHVAGADSAMLVTLADKSLLQASGPQRYDIHALLCQYAAEKLDQRPEEAAETRCRHAGYYASFLEAREEQAQGDGQAVLPEISVEIENVWTAWGWAVAHADAVLIGRAAGSLYVVCETRGWFQPGADAFAAAAAAVRETVANAIHTGSDSDDAENRLRLILGRVLTRQAGLQFRLGQHAEARSLLVDSLDVLGPLRQTGLAGAQAEVAFARKLLGNVAYRCGDYAAARRQQKLSLALYTELGNRWEIARCLSNLGIVARQSDQLAEAERYLRESLALRRDLGDLRGVATSLGSLGVTAYDRGNYAEAARLWQESLEIAQAIGHAAGVGVALNNMGRVAYELGDYRGAEERCRASLTICRDIGYQQGIVISLHMLGRVATAIGQHAAAKRHLQAALAMATSAGMRPAVLRILVAVAELMLASDVFSETVPPALTDRQPIAVELLAAVLENQAAELRTRRRAQELLDTLAPEMSVERLEAARHRGVSAQLDALVRQLFPNGAP